MTERKDEVPTRLVFGEWLEGIHASDSNPTKRGMFVRKYHRTGKLNPGTFVELTDGKGKFWSFWLKDVRRVDSDQAPATTLTALQERVRELEGALDSSPEGSNLWRFWRDKATQLTEENAALRRANDHYQYLGRDGKTVLAKDLEAERDRLREALEFYANPFDYVKRHGLDEQTPDFYDELDFGARAHAALRGEGE